MNKSDLLSIDPSHSGLTGWALFSGDKLLEYGTLTATDASDFLTRINLIQQAHEVVIEDAFLYKNPKVYGLLVAARCNWEVPARDLLGLPVTLVKPEAWMRAITGSRKFGGSSKDTKALEFYIRQRWDLGENVELTKDTISAIGLGTFFIDLKKIKSKSKETGRAI